MTSLLSRPATPTSDGSHTATARLTPSAFANGRYNRVLSTEQSPTSPSSRSSLTIDEVRRWSHANVAAWLTSHRLAHHTLTFARNDITGQVLLDVDQNALRDMGIVAVGDRIRVSSAIKALKKKCVDSGHARQAALFLAQEKAEVAQRAQLYAEQLREDERLMEQLNRPYDMSSLQHSSNGEVEYLNGAPGSQDGARYIAGLGALDGAAAAAAAGLTLEQRIRSNSRPPPLRLSGSASSNMPTTPTDPSPSLRASTNHIYPHPTPGFSQSRGLAAGSSNGIGVSRGSSSFDRSSGLSRSGSALMPAVRSGEGRSGSVTAPSSNPLSHHRKTNSALAGIFSSPFNQAVSAEDSGIAPRAFGSLGAQTSSGLAGARPSTASAYVHEQSNAARIAAPKSNGNSNSPTASHSSTRQKRPATADAGYESHNFMGSLGGPDGGTSISGVTAPPLTPITEGNFHSPTTPTSLINLGRQGQSSISRAGASTIGFRYSNHLAAPSGSAASSNVRGGGTPPHSSFDAGPHPSLEDLKRRTIKFIGDDGTTRIVNVSDCVDAYEVLARVLKKFGKSLSANSYPPTQGQSLSVGDEGLDVGSGSGDKYVIVATSGEGASRDLKPEELLAICHAPQPHDPLRERGLVLRKVSPGVSTVDSTSRRMARSGRHKLEAFFGERVHDNHHQHATGQSAQMTIPGSGTSGPDHSLSTTVGHVTTAGKKMNRASTLSIMSGLGAGALMAMATAGHIATGSNTQSSPSRPSSRDAAGGMPLSPGTESTSRRDEADIAQKSTSAVAAVLPLTRKTRNFMGQRPPSELISNHLADFFPATEKRILERTARKSMYGRASMSLRSSKRDSTWSFRGTTGDDTPPPPLPTKSGNDYEVKKGNRKESSTFNAPSTSNVPTLPFVVSGFSLDDWSKSIQQSVDDDAPTGAHLEPPELAQYASRPRSHRQTSDPSSARVSMESTRSRKSYASHMRTTRGGPSNSVAGFSISSSSYNRPASTLNDRSDAVSLLTLDEITQEVENRRLSQSLAEDDEGGDDANWVVDGDGVPIPIGPAASRGTRAGERLSSRHRSKARDAQSVQAADRTSGASVRNRRSSVVEVVDDSYGSPQERSSGLDTATGGVIPERTSPAMNVQRAVLSSSLQEEDEEDDDEDSISESSFLDEYGEDGQSEKEMKEEGEDEEEEDQTYEEGLKTSEALSTSIGKDVFAGRDDDTLASGRDLIRSTSGASVAPRSLPLAGATAKKSPASGLSKQPIKWIKGALIGAGSFGSVYLGMNAKNGLLMAVKQVELPSGQSQNDQKKKRMLDALEGEIELLKTLQHGNIVQYLDSYADGTHLNIFLEYVPGGSVVALLRNYGAFEEPLVRNFVRQILHGLSFLHGQDIVHRDIKGANILVDNKSCIKISDFGISKKVESDLLTNARAHRPSLQGSVFWMAPEVVKQTSYTRKADVWSLGCLVVEMMSGTHPWPNLNQMQALFKIGSSAKPSLPEEISEEAVDFLNKTFEIDHERRPTADELLRHAFITEEPLGGGGGGDNGREDEGEEQREEGTMMTTVATTT